MKPLVLALFLAGLTACPAEDAERKPASEPGVQGEPAAPPPAEPAAGIGTGGGTAPTATATPAR